MRLFKSSLFLTVGILFCLSCVPTKDDLGTKPLEDEIAVIKTTFAPDKRVVLFNVTAKKDADKYILKGETDKPKALQALKDTLTSTNITFIDSVKVLPNADLNGKTKAIINISVANLRSNPKHSAELATQATLGTPVKVLKKEGSWYYIQTPDKYLSWVDDGGITLMNDQEAEIWKKADMIIYTETYGHAYGDTNKESIVSDLVAGNLLKIITIESDFYKVMFPDGRLAYVTKNQAQDYKKWLANLNTTVDDLVATSKRFMGVPYLWGGTSTKGMDCSGFTKTIYFLNGMVIPRDASQQVHAGKFIDDRHNFENLRKGDLLFFGTKATDSTKERVVHVGMWIGNNEFIHESNMVRISSMDPNAPNFDEWNRNRYLRSKRILHQKDNDLIDLTQTPFFTD